MTETPIKLTPTQKRIMSVLADGREHRNSEIIKAWDEFATTNALRQQMFALRKQLEPSGKTVMSVWGGYRLVSLKLD